MRVVLDTNVLLVSIPSAGLHYPIFDVLVNRKFDLLITQEIFLEYYEIIERRGSKQSVKNFNRFILEGENVLLINVHYKWHLIRADPDDNKFVDCAIAGNADYLVTNDSHFEILKKQGFPVVTVISAEDFFKSAG